MTEQEKAELTKVIRPKSLNNKERKIIQPVSIYLSHELFKNGFIQMPKDFKRFINITLTFDNYTNIFDLQFWAEKMNNDIRDEKKGIIPSYVIMQNCIMLNIHYPKKVRNVALDEKLMTYFTNFPYELRNYDNLLRSHKDQEIL